MTDMKKEWRNLLFIVFPIFIVAIGMVWWSLTIKPLSMREWFHIKQREKYVKKQFQINIRKREQSLKWLDKASAKEQFKKDMASKQYNFYGCYGYSLTTPGIDWIDYEVCYRQYAKIREIDGTSDVIVSKEHGRLIGLAYRYAEEYNLLMQDHLLKNGMTCCRLGENWGKAFGELNDFIWGKSQAEGDLGMPVPFKLSKPTFIIGLKDKSRADVVSLKACECFVNNGIHRRVYFNMAEYKRIDEKWCETPIYKFYCENGKPRKSQSEQTTAGSTKP